MSQVPAAIDMRMPSLCQQTPQVHIVAQSRCLQLAPASIRFQAHLEQRAQAQARVVHARDAAASSLHQLLRCWAGGADLQVQRHSHALRALRSSQTKAQASTIVISLIVLGTWRKPVVKESAEPGEGTAGQGRVWMPLL